MMMQETVIAIMGQPGGAGGMVAYLDSPSTHCNADDFCPLVLDPTVLPPLDTVATSRPMERLCAPPGISSGDPPRLRQYIRQRLAEPFNAEISHQERECGAIAVGSTLRGPRSIHGSERHVRYQQVTPAKVGPGLRSFVYPLRMAAFLSAAGVKAEPELERFANRF
jgi:hypothetical protein